MTARTFPTPMSTEEFRERIRQLVGVLPKNPEDRPCVRKPTDRGYYPPTKTTTKGTK